MKIEVFRLGFVCIFFTSSVSVVFSDTSTSSVKHINTSQICLLDPNPDLNC